MALKASLGVILGCQFGPANRLLAAADKGDERVVAQVRRPEQAVVAQARHKCPEVPGVAALRSKVVNQLLGATAFAKEPADSHMDRVDRCGHNDDLTPPLLPPLQQPLPTSHYESHASCIACVAGVV